MIYWRAALGFLLLSLPLASFGSGDEKPRTYADCRLAITLWELAVYNAPRVAGRSLPEVPAVTPITQAQWMLGTPGDPTGFPSVEDALERVGQPMVFTHPIDRYVYLILAGVLERNMTEEDSMMVEDYLFRIQDLVEDYVKSRDEDAPLDLGQMMLPLLNLNSRIRARPERFGPNFINDYLGTIPLTQNTFLATALVLRAKIGVTGFRAHFQVALMTDRPEGESARMIPRERVIKKYAQALRDYQLTERLIFGDEGDPRIPLPLERPSDEFTKDPIAYARNVIVVHPELPEIHRRFILKTLAEMDRYSLPVYPHYVEYLSALELLLEEAVH